ncbi:GDP-L-fucose synthase [Psychrobacter immobilis]|uniref:GDP-L-fucose synthase n=1 Tax=Psychrobacter immobilis TaxID=498 RepID=A0A2V1ZIT6_PSYIM|nr:GDP-L-fucose synthase [Psychrobacter immobilis]PWK06881.1 GDP-L-fucose synthase [Psychrobacter immobilis]
MPMQYQDKIYIAGHQGMVGSAITRLLTKLGYDNLLTADRSELDLLSQQQVADFFSTHQPDYVFLAAAKVGGIQANNSYPADFIYNNLMIQNNIIHSAYEVQVKRLLFLGSSCIYPKNASQPMTEDSLLSGPLEPTNEPYAIAKIAGIKMCESYNRQYATDFRSVMPTNLYGQNDNFHPENSHVLPALLRRFHEAKQNDIPKVVVWGSGTPKREFLHVDDMAAACLHVMTLEKSTWQQAVTPMCSHINVGYGSDISIKELALLIAKIVGYQGQIVFDDSKPDGTPRKLLDSSLLTNFGWQAQILLEQGTKSTYEWFCQTNEIRE